MKEYQHNNVTIRIHDANIDPVQRRKHLEEATIKLMKEVVKKEGDLNVDDKIIPTSRTSIDRN